jgi:hypothetical protein
MFQCPFCGRRFGVPVVDEFEKKLGTEGVSCK